MPTSSSHAGAVTRNVVRRLLAATCAVMVWVFLQGCHKNSREYVADVEQVVSAMRSDMDEAARMSVTTDVLEQQFERKYGFTHEKKLSYNYVHAAYQEFRSLPLESKGQSNQIGDIRVLFNQAVREARRGK